MSVLLISSVASSQIIIYRFGLGQQKADAVIYKKDKQTVSGILKFPLLEDKNVKIKVGENNEKLASKDIDSIQIFDADKKLSYTFLWTKTKEYKKKGTEFKVVKEKWICKIIDGKLSLYLGGEEYGIKAVKVEDEDTKEKVKEAKMKVVAKMVTHYLKRNNEDYPVQVSISTNGNSIGYNAYFKKLGVYYFNDDAEISKKIEDKEYKYDDIEKVVNLYNAKRVKKPEPKVEPKSEAKATKPKATTPKTTSKAKTPKKK